MSQSRRLLGVVPPASLALGLLAGVAFSTVGCDRDTLIGIDIPPLGTGGVRGAASGGVSGSGSGGVRSSTGGVFGSGSGGVHSSTGGVFGSSTGGVFGSSTGGVRSSTGGVFGSGSGGVSGSGSGGASSACSVITTQPRALNPCGRATALAFSPDGALLAVSTQLPGQVNLHVWRVSDGSLAYDVPRADNPNGTFGVAFSPDGKLLALGGQAPILDGAGASAAAILDATTGDLLRLLPTQSGRYVNAVTFSHDGKRLVTGGASSFIDVWNVADGSELLAIPNPESIFAVDLSPDDSRFVTSGGGTLRIKNTSDGTEVAQISVFDQMNRATYSPNGQLILGVAGAGQLQILDSNGVTLQVMTFRAGTDLDPIGYAAWIDDSHFVVDDWVGTVQEWVKDPAQSQGPFTPKQTWQMPGQALGIAVAPDRQSIVVGGNSGFMFLAL